MQMVAARIDSDIDLLRDAVAGSVLIPGDRRYEQTLRGWNLSIDQHPAVILIANNADDVIAGVNYAHEQGMSVAVQSSSSAPPRLDNGTLLISTSRMSTVQVDPETRTARAGAGAIWRQVLNMAAEYGLAPLITASPNDNVVSRTLDGVRAVEIVTLDGVQCRVSADEKRRGLRGSSFSIVTALEIDLYPAQPMVKPLRIGG